MVSIILQNIVQAGWDSVDFDDELSAKTKQPYPNGYNLDNLASLMGQLKGKGIPTSHTCIAGSQFTNKGQPYKNLQKLLDKTSGGEDIDQIHLMNYAVTMYPEAEYHYVTDNIKSTTELGVSSDKIMLGATTDLLNPTNLQTWINTVRGLKGSLNPNPGSTLGGLFLWSASNKEEPVDPSLMQQIKAGLGNYSESTVTNKTLVGQQNSESSTIHETSYSDILIGDNQSINQNSSSSHNFMQRPRINPDQVDKLIGYEGPDLFVLGTEHDVLYDSNGKSDRANILDLSLSEGDRIQLQGSRDDYELIKLGTSFIGRNAFYSLNKEGGEQIAFIQSIDDNGTSLELNNSDPWVFV
ncbi:hypothetical protein [Prochlorococcus marinus]|uniref:hypothetical protein n=1 Tax=Prochlorococcus marinus TaxID=1219 RepID=UPI0007B357EE|nr:hypothetical protein [Prochlorococcus marinus]KZR73797.1 hypothetical protein PMIT1320_02393 [Prochlorococcus marinus str. MIT 1320]